MEDKLDTLLHSSFEELVKTNTITREVQLTDNLKVTLKGLNSKQSLSAESYFEKNWVYIGDIVGRARKLSIISAAVVKINEIEIDRSTDEKDMSATLKIRNKLLELGGEVIDCLYEEYIEILKQRQKMFKDFGGALKNFIAPPQEKS